MQKIIRLFDALPVLQPGSWHCPRESGPLVSFAFRGDPDGPDLATASVLAEVRPSQTGCDAMSFSIDGQPQDALVKARQFLRAVGRLLATQLTEPRHR